MLLAIDTSTAQIGLALYDGTSVPGECVWHSGLHHTEELAPALAELLRRVGIKMDDVAALGVALGPGSFTSLRVGLAFVKGLVLACHIPIVGIPTLDIVAGAVPLPGTLIVPPEPEVPTQASHSPRLAAVLPAGRGRLALGWYTAGGSGWQADGPAMVTTADELADQIHKPVIICGEMSADERHRLMRKFKNVSLAPPSQCVRRPAILAELAWQKWQAGKTDLAATLAPIYIHVAGGLPA
ncbi:MAG: tRNA (adenosine(37)-N6)-threonylcarbamoyltransferase complex dimerization subunit type 1 TsaB [Anaerolineales bacterium]|jgi:tRNA threonylcarbamoyladenosine biosynthesis protein TsaB